MPTGVKRTIKTNQIKTNMRKTPIQDILTFTKAEYDIYTNEAPSIKALQICLKLGLLVADQIDSQGKATRFRLTKYGYKQAEKIEKKQQAEQDRREAEQYAFLEFCSDGVC